MLEMNFLKIMETYVFMKDTFRIFLENPLAFLACLGYARSKEKTGRKTEIEKCVASGD